MLILIVWRPVEFSRLHFTSLPLELSLIQSPLGRIISAFEHFAAAIANHYYLVVSFYQAPVKAGWTEVA